MTYSGIDRRKSQSLLRLYDREPILRMQQQVSHLNREALPCENFDAAALMICSEMAVCVPMASMETTAPFKSSK